MPRQATRRSAGRDLDAATLRRRRLEQLLRLALAYKDCSRKELARVLGRDPTKLVPGTGLPKLDLVVELAGVLDWPVGDVVSFLWSNHDTPADASADSPQARARACRREALRCRRLGCYVDVVGAATRGLQETGVAPALRRRLQDRIAAMRSRMKGTFVVPTPEQVERFKAETWPEYLRDLRKRMAREPEGP